MEEGEGLLGINEDINSDMVSPQGNKLSKQKKLTILGISLVSVIIIIIILVIAIGPDKKEKGKGGGGGEGGGEKEEEEPQKEEEEEEEEEEEPYVPPDIKDDILGKIECIYDVDSTRETTKILNENYNIPSKMKLEIERTPEKVAKNHKFSKAGANNVTFILYEDINMENMFKGVSSLYSVKLISKQNCKITSLVGAFENCEKLNYF